MIISKKEAEDRLDNLITTLSMIRVGSIEGDIKEEICKYTKWYAEKIIDRCAEAAELRYSDNSTYPDNIIVSEQSILSVKNEL